MSEAEKILIFTDGACSGNPGPGGWGAIVSVPDGETWELGGAQAATTNNQMEIKASIEALKSLDSKMRPELSADLYTDSRYLIDGITKWINGWKKRDWKTATDFSDVKNKELWMELDEVVQKFSRSRKLSWKHIEAHSLYAANERCDEIAVAHSKLQSVELFRGPSSKYEVRLDVPFEEAPGPRHVYYLSLIGNEIHRDKTWDICQARVKGLRGARYKKVRSLREEAEILKQWGYLKG